MDTSLPDEKKVYALISAVGINRERLRQGIDGLRQIHNVWKGTNGTCINLIAQLTALKSNLGSMQDWLNYALHDLHPQLLLDLEVLMSSCALLVRHIDALISRLKQPDHDTVDFAIKLKYAVGSKSMDRLRKVAQRQNDAVTLLLAACKCQRYRTTQDLASQESANSQRRLFESQNACTHIKMEWWLHTTPHSRVAHDPVVPTNVLFQALTSNLEKFPAPTGEDYENEAAAIRSEAIDRALAEEATTLRRETKLVLMGDTNSGKELIMHQIKVLYAEGYYPFEERMKFRNAVRSTVRLLVHSIIDLLKDTGVTLPKSLNQDFAVLLHEVETVDVHRISEEAVRAIINIWHSAEFTELYIKNFEIDFPQYSPYFANEIHRIASGDFVPDQADIVRLNHGRIGGIKELRFNWDVLDVHLFNVSHYIPEQFRKRWSHQLENSTALIYTVDVSLYDRPYLGQPNQSHLLADLETFEARATWPKFANSSIILLLNNFTRFREKLQYAPLQTFFPDFVPDEADPETSARQYVLRRFKDVNRSRLSIYSFWVDLDTGDNQHLYAALKKTLQHIQQRRARLEVWNASETLSRSDSRSGALSGILSPARSLSLKRERSGSLSRKRSGTFGTQQSRGESRVMSPVLSEGVEEKE